LGFLAKRRLLLAALACLAAPWPMGSQRLVRMLLLLAAMRNVVKLELLLFVKPGEMLALSL
jgi:hypothetical protein